MAFSSIGALVLLFVVYTSCETSSTVSTIARHTSERSSMTLQQFLGVPGDIHVWDDKLEVLDDSRSIEKITFLMQGFPILGLKVILEYDEDEEVKWAITGGESSLDFGNIIQDFESLSRNINLTTPAKSIAEERCREHIARESIFAIIPENLKVYGTGRYLYYTDSGLTFVDEVHLYDDTDVTEEYYCLVDLYYNNYQIVLSSKTVRDVRARAGTDGPYSPERFVDLKGMPTSPEGKCLLQNPEGTLRIMDMKNQNSRKRAIPLEYNCEESPDQEWNGAYGLAADCYNNILRIQDCFAKYVDYPDLIGNLSQQTDGGAFNVYVHYGIASTDARSVPRAGLVFGDGNASGYGKCSSLVTVGHEIGHRLIIGHSHFDESGWNNKEVKCMNEAFADMTGLFAEACVNDGVTGWWVGRDWSRINDTKGTRRIDQEEANDAYVWHYRDFNPDETEGHRCGGIFGHAFYRLATTTGWDIFKAYKLFFGANMNYWSSKDQMTDAACGVLRYAQVKGDYSANQIQEIKSAFGDVGVVVKDCSADRNGLEPRKEGERDIFLLDNCVPLYGVYGYGNGYTEYHKILIPPKTNPTRLVVTLRPNGDEKNLAKLFVKYKSLPTSPADYDFGENLTSSIITINIKEPQQGSYYIMVTGAEVFENMRLTACYFTEPGEEGSGSGGSGIVVEGSGSEGSGATVEDSVGEGSGFEGSGNND